MPVYSSMKIIRNRPGLDYAGPSPSTAWLIAAMHSYYDGDPLYIKIGKLKEMKEFGAIYSIDRI